ncbi:MAG: hypothetical protein KAH22_09495, partial [Thiotrichaceae bacterium]|nr:hypothetical protein [Thiotrichaceae bacterium]
MILKKYTNHFISAIALIVGLGLAYVLLSTPADLWLIIATALLFVLLAYWQSKRIRVHLVGDTLQREKGRLRYWLPRLFLFLVFVVMGLLAHSFWWAQQQVQSQYKLLSDEVKADYPLPYSS